MTSTIEANKALVHRCMQAVIMDTQATAAAFA
jgi:hypothetical protein